MLSNAIEFLGVILLAMFLGFAVAWPYVLLPFAIYFLVTGYAIDRDPSDDGSDE